MDNPRDQVQQQYAQSTTPLPSLEGRQYSEAHYRFIGSLIEAKSAHSLFEDIANSNFSAQTILAFKKVILTMFDKNAILAKYDNIGRQIRVLECEKALNLMVVECRKSDTQDGAFHNFQNAIRVMFADFLSRAGTERDQLLKTEYSMSQSQPQQQQGGGMLGFGGR